VKPKKGWSTGDEVRASAEGDVLYGLESQEKGRENGDQGEECSFLFYLAKPTNDLSSKQANFHPQNPRRFCVFQAI
jgi:hypothetical protein